MIFFVLILKVFSLCLFLLFFAGNFKTIFRNMHINCFICPHIGGVFQNEICCILWLKNNNIHCFLTVKMQTMLKINLSWFSASLSIKSRKDFVEVNNQTRPVVLLPEFSKSFYLLWCKCNEMGPEHLIIPYHIPNESINRRQQSCSFPAPNTPGVERVGYADEIGIILIRKSTFSIKCPKK